MNGRGIESAVYKLSFSIVVAMVLVGLVEIASYLVLRFYPHPVVEAPVRWSQVKPSGTERNREQEQAEWNVEYQPWVEWGLKPFQGRTAVNEPEGTRRTFNSRCAPGAYTIWMFGGSAMWGDSLPDWETIPSFLAAEYAKHGHPVCVRNYGTVAWVNTQEMLKLILELERAARPPSLVIFYDGANEPISLYRARGGVDTHQYDDLLRTALSTLDRRPSGFHYLLDTNTYRLLVRVHQHRVKPKPSEWGRIPDSQVAAQFNLGYLKNLEIVEALARQYGFQCAFFWQPVMWAHQKPLTPDEQEIHRAYVQAYPGLDALTAKIYALAGREKRPDYFNVSDLFAGAHENLYFDPWHTNGTAARAVAERIYELVEKSYPQPGNEGRSNPKPPGAALEEGVNQGRDGGSLDKNQ